MKNEPKNEEYLNFLRKNLIKEYDPKREILFPKEEIDGIRDILNEVQRKLDHISGEVSRIKKRPSGRFGPG